MEAVELHIKLYTFNIKYIYGLILHPKQKKSTVELDLGEQLTVLPLL